MAPTKALPLMVMGHDRGHGEVQDKRLDEDMNEPPLPSAQKWGHVDSRGYVPFLVSIETIHGKFSHTPWPLYEKKS